jgi:isopenicillin N synthase-like dioxygenase
LPDVDRRAFPPIVDFSASDAVAQIDAACREVGFFQLVEHGIPHDTIAKVFMEVDRFFAQPVEEKLRWSSPSPEIERGYSARGSEGLAYSIGLEQPPDLFEAFTMGREHYPTGDPLFNDDRHHFFAPNIWPDAAGFRPAMSAYFAAVQSLTHRLTSMFAQALSLDSNFFEVRTGHSLDTLRVNYFEGLPGETPLPGQFGIGPHTDYGIVTVLLADQTPGLQVLDPSGEWRGVLPVPGALIVNLADLLAQWTNDHWRSTVHRVQAMRSSSGRAIRRRSLPFFHEGDFDAVVECLPSCTTAEDPPRYQPVVAGEHVMAKVLSGLLRTRADAGSTLGDRVAVVGGSAG